MTTKVTSDLIDQSGNVNYTAANVTLGPVANVHISGGTTGQAIITDGAGNLSFGDAGSTLTIKDEGSNLTTTATSMDFVGAGVTATNTGNSVTITIPGGGGNARTMGYSLVFGG